MAQLQQMKANFSSHLDYLIDEMCQMNTQVDRIARTQARIGDFNPSPKASTDEDDDVGDDKDDDACSSSDDEMTTSQ